MILGQVVLDRRSPFENRVGQVRIAGSLSQDAPLRFELGRLDLTLDYGLGVERAPCAPPLGLDAPIGKPAQPVESELLARYHADAALAMSRGLVSRLFQAAAQAGFACRGLDGTMEPLARDELMLESVGLAEAPVGPTLELVLGSGALPTVELVPVDNALRVRWEALVVDLYGETVEGLPTRLLTAAEHGGGGAAAPLRR